MGNDVWSEGFRSRLELILLERGISKAEMARRCGLPARTVENYFKGHKPGIDALLALSRGLSLSVDWLLGDEDWHRSDHSELVSEATWQAAKEHLIDIVKDVGSGRPVIEGGKIYGSDPEAFAARIATNATQKYCALLSFRDEPQSRKTSKRTGEKADGTQGE